MAHEIEMDEQGARMIYAQGSEVPWHGLGFQVDPKASPEEWMIAARCDWTVEKIPLSGKFVPPADTNGKFQKHIVIETQAEALIRSTDQKVLSIVTDGWNPVQNAEAFEFFKEYCDAGSMTMETAGSLKEGRHVWALAKTTDSFEIFGGDKIEGYLLFSNPHQYGCGIDVRFTPIRVVCNNTITLALEGKVDKAVKVSHRRAFDADLVKQQLGIAHKKLEQYKEVAEFLGSKKFNDQLAIEYFSQVFPKMSTKATTANDNKDLSRLAKQAMEQIYTQPGAKFAEGSFWQLFNAATFTMDHLAGRNADNRVYNSFFGYGVGTKLKALDLAHKMAKVA